MRLRFWIFFQIFLLVSLEPPRYTVICALYFVSSSIRCFQNLTLKCISFPHFVFYKLKYHCADNSNYICYTSFFILGVRARVCLVYSHMRQNLRVPKKIYDNDLVFERGCHMSNLKREKQNLKSSLVFGKPTETPATLYYIKYLESLLKHLQLYNILTLYSVHRRPHLIPNNHSHSHIHHS